MISSPVGIAERRIDRHNVVWRYPLCGKIRAQDPVGRARIDVVSAEQNPSANFASFLAHQISNGRNCLLIGRGSRVENVARAFFALVLHWVEEQAVQLLEDRQNGFAGGGGPAAEHDRDLFLREQFPGFFGKEVPIGRGINDNRFQFPSEQPTFLVLVCYQHENRVLKHRFADCHGAGQRMQNTDFDGIFACANRWNDEHELQNEQSQRDDLAGPKLTSCRCPDELENAGFLCHALGNDQLEGSELEAMLSPQIDAFAHKDRRSQTACSGLRGALPDLPYCQGPCSSCARSTQGCRRRPPRHECQTA